MARRPGLLEQNAELCFSAQTEAERASEQKLQRQHRGATVVWKAEADAQDTLLLKEEFIIICRQEMRL